MSSKSYDVGATPLVSVCIPAYNHGRYIQEALRSVLEQDWPRMEIVLLDDGSTDDTFEKAREMKALFDERFERVVFEKKRNEGTCATLNRLCKLSSGDFTLLPASDDALLPGAVRALLAPMLCDDSIGVSVGVNEIMDGSGRRCYWDEKRNIVYDEHKAAFITFNDAIASYSGVNIGSPKFGDYYELARYNHVPNGCLFRKSVLDRILPFTPEAPLEDYWMHLQLAKITRYASVHEHTYRYRWHGANTVKQTEKMRWNEYKTLKWEESYVLSPAGAEWKDRFFSARHVTMRKPMLGRMLFRETVKDLDNCTKVIHVLGMKFVYKRKSIAATPFAATVLMLLSAILP